MRPSIAQSNKIFLTETAFEDLDTVLSIENSQDAEKFVYSWPRARHQEAITNPDEAHLLLKECGSEKIIGYVLLSGLTNEDRSIEFRRIALSITGQGYGKMALALILKLCFENYGCHRLWLDVFEDNHRALRLYQKMGFIQEGTLRECKKSNTGYRSMIIMSMLEQEYYRHRSTSRS
ncbi:Protein N-acetyltransferase, RimJ/RimL family [Geosporobacter subterraneus DSM 17957]|uniref:Protein N-acetyltransferase, RimJ/RimL family n=1 Tax=Geosporobacter subterraneus DSM 17957 TaxID=1121919 RepID=A0A1M6F242_9FIRM|nr:GNAT family protein [Geosporobacter subterraneus]SHI91706.1 Protein N-acetyltransferase, RimJ/RimL family [Geosporobacter subterraneus DSM 17957]